MTTPALVLRCPLGSAEYSGIDRDIRLHLGQLKTVPSIQPREGELERELNAAHGAVIVVIDLGRNAADGRPAVTYHSPQQPRLLVEIQSYEKAARAVALHHLDGMAVDRVIKAGAQVGEYLPELN